jgi:hypothetical protein
MAVGLVIATERMRKTNLFDEILAGRRNLKLKYYLFSSQALV